MISVKEKSSFYLKKINDRTHKKDGNVKYKKITQNSYLFRKKKIVL